MTRAPESRRTAILRIVGAQDKLSAATIEVRLRSLGHEVTRRTLERDLLMLAEEGELLGDDSKPRGYRRAPGGPLMARRRLEPAEVVLLRLARRHLRYLLPGGLERLFDALLDGAEDAAGAAYERAAGKAPAVVRWPDKVRVVPANLARISPRVSAAVYNAVSEALLHERQVDIVYWARYRNATSAYRLSPLALLQRGAVQFLVAARQADPPVRSYALQRIRRITVVDEPARAPPGFDLDDWMDSGEMGFLPKGEVDLVLHLSKEAKLSLEESPLARAQVIESNEDGAGTLKVTINWTAQLEQWILGMGEGVEVVEPQALRQTVASRLQAATRQYLR